MELAWINVGILRKYNILCWFMEQDMVVGAGKKSSILVTSIDLAGAGSSMLDPNNIMSFHDYTMPLVEFLSQLSAIHF